MSSTTIAPTLAVDSALAKPTKPLSAFARLSPIVGLYEPQSTSKPLSSSPTTILFCSWMNASPKHIQYYTDKYIKLYPSTRIILVTINTKEFLIHSETRRRKDIKEAVAALLSRDQSSERLFVHALSNGGSKRVYGIAGAYRVLTGKALPIKSYIFDSAPGIPHFWRDIHALSMPAKKLNWAVYLVYMSFIYVAVSLVFVTVNWMPKSFWRQLVWGPVDGINDLALIDGKCVKGFVYSKEDLAIDWRDVERLAGLAEKKGYRTLMKRIEGAQHVQMFKGKGGEEDYWGYIRQVCELGMNSKLETEA